MSDEQRVPLFPVATIAPLLVTKAGLAKRSTCPRPISAHPPGRKPKHAKRRPPRQRGSPIALGPRQTSRKSLTTRGRKLRSPRAATALQVNSPRSWAGS